MPTEDEARREKLEALSQKELVDRVIELEQTVSAQQRELETEQRISESFFEGLPGISYMFGEDLRFIRWNTEFERATGYSAQELADLSPLDLFDEDESQTVAERIEAVFGAGQSDVVAQLVAKNGDQTPHLFTGRRASIDGVTYVVGMGIDISERQQSELQLREAEERFRAMFEHAPVGAALLDIEGHPVLTNRALQELVGYDGDQLAQLSFAEFTHPDDVDADLARFEQLIAGEIPEYTMEKRYIHADGHVVWGNLSVTIVRHDDGSPRYILGMVSDITARKHLERERLVFQRLVEATSQGIGMAHLDGTVYYLNPSLRAMTSIGPKEELPSSTIDGFYSDRWKSLITEEVLPTVLDEGRWHGNLEITRVDGTVFPSIESYFLIRDDNGEPLFIGDVITDISEERRVQAELQAKSAELERSNAELEQFAYVASHDLQEPLRMVTSYLQLLERRYGHTFEDDAREFVDFAVDGATRMKSLIHAILEFSRVGTRGRPFEAVDLNTVVEDVLRRLRPAVEERSAEITVTTTLPTVTADLIQMGQLLQNLFSNAIKFSRETNPQVMVDAEQADDRLWIVSVADNGIGIEPAHRGQVFEVFRRLHGRGDYPGTGIGLAICRKIVERHGGRIWVEDSAAGGATFRFTIPTAEEAFDGSR